MDIVSYNEQQNRQSGFRHIFFPSLTTFIYEIVIAALALIIFNFRLLDDKLISTQANPDDPLPRSTDLLSNFFSVIQQYEVVRQVLLFALWAIVGVLIYLLIYRIARLIKSTSGGAFGSLHDYIVRVMTIIAGTMVVLVGVLVCSGVASQELHAGLVGSFPGNLLQLSLSFLLSYLSVRLTILGICLISDWFRRWYTTL